MAGFSIHLSVLFLLSTGCAGYFSIPTSDDDNSDYFAALSKTCPRTCDCLTFQLSRSIMCESGGFLEIPNYLPSPTRKLNLRHNQISEIGDHVNMYSQLELLDLSENMITKLNPGTFRNLTNLRWLRLEKNKIKDIHVESFKGLSWLLTLNLNDNNIGYIPAGTFSDLKNLRTLYLSHNMLSNIQMSSGTFAGLYMLASLMLKNNNLRAVPAGALGAVNKTDILDLSYNNIRVLQRHDFADVRHLGELRLNDNNISTVNRWAFQGLLHLKNLFLHNNAMAYVPTEALVTLAQLQFLDVSDNMFTVLHEQSFTSMPKLEHIKINHCPRLKSILANAFSDGLGHLQSLEINNNRLLHHIDRDAFNELYSLKSVYLNDNNLVTINDDLLEWEFLERIDLNRNPWRCDCDLKWLPTMMNVAKDTTKQLLTMVKCRAPNRMFNKTIMRTSPKDYVCHYHRTDHRIVVASIATGCVLVIIIVVVLIFKSRHYIADKWRGRFRYKMFDTGSVQLSRQEETNSQSEPC